LGKDAGMTIEEILIEHRIIVGQCLGQAGETRSWNFLERRLVSFISATGRKKMKRDEKREQ